MPVIDQGFGDLKYHVIPRTLIFLFDSLNRVLLIKGSNKKQRWPGKYNGVGGHIESGEDILEAALRELKEESGITDVELDLVGQIMIQISESAGVAIFLFRGNYERSDFVSSHEGTLEWIKISDLNKIPIVEDLSFLLPRVISHHPCDAMIIGKYSYDDHGKLLNLFR